MADKPGAILDTIAWFLVSISGLAVIGRSGVKAGVIQKIGADDVFIWCAMIFFVAQVITLHLQVKIGGLGQHMTDLSETQKDFILKMDYAGDLLFMPVYGFAKLSVVSLLRKFALGRRDRLLLYSFEWCLAGWAASSVFVYAFQCALPHPWDYVHQTCLNRRVWGAYFEAMNIITDLMLVIMPTIVILTLKATLKKRIASSFFFVARLVILPISLLRIHLWLRDAFTDDVTYTMFSYSVATLIVSALEILAACVLYLQPLFETLESGFMWGGDLRRRGQGFHPQWDFGNKGNLPFTRMRTPISEDVFTSRGVEYRVTAEGPGMLDTSDEEKTIESPEMFPDKIHKQETIDVHTSPHPRERESLPTTKLEQEALAATEEIQSITQRRSNDSSQPNSGKPRSWKRRSTATTGEASNDGSTPRTSWSFSRYFSMGLSSKHTSGVPEVPPLPSPVQKSQTKTPNLDVHVPDSPFRSTPIVNHPNIAAVIDVDKNKALPSMPPPPAIPIEPVRPTLEEKRMPSQGW